MKKMNTAMILAAGLGTRLKPFTDNRPKALFEYMGKTMLEIVIGKLQESGFHRLIINIHHFGDQIVDYLSDKNNFGADIIISDERNELLDTGGGLKKASVHFGSTPVLVHNVDILTDLDLNAFYNFHLNHNSPASLAVKTRETSRSLLMDDKNLLCGWRNDSTGEEIIARPKENLQPVAFSGIYIINSDFCKLCPQEGPFPVMQEFLRIAADKDILLYPHNQNSWKDMGKRS